MKKRTFDNMAKQRIAGLVQGALRILPFDAMNRIQYRFEHIGEGTFNNTNTAAVNNIPYKLTVNIDWYENAEEADVKFMMRHEARHLYQQNQIEKLSTGKPVEEDPDVIMQWDKEFTPGNYVSNIPGREREHFTQACEIDAYVFSSFICNTETVREDGTLSLSIVQYPVIADLVEERVLHILQATPMEDLIKYRNFFSKQQA